MRWKNLLELNEARMIVAGSPQELRKAIGRGADLRIYTSFRYNEHLDTTSKNTEMVDEVSDFRTSYLINNEWAGGIMTLRLPIDPPVGFGPRPSMSFFLYNENGDQSIARPCLDGTAAHGSPGPEEVRLYPDMPRYQEHSRWDDQTNAPSSNFYYSFDRFRYFANDTWEEVYSHDSGGSARSGSLDSLTTAFKSGCDIKVGIEGLCNDLGGSMPCHTVFVPCGPGYYHPESRVFCCGTHPLIRVAPNIPLHYKSNNWDFGWLFVRTDGFVEYWRCDPYTLAFSKLSWHLAVRWFVR